MGNILALLRDLGKSPVARDLFIKLDSIGARIFNVGFKNSCWDVIPANTVVLLKVRNYFSYLRNLSWLEIFCFWNLINKIIFKC